MIEHAFDRADAISMETVEAWDEAVTQARLGRLQTTAVLDRERGFTYDGYLSTTAFLMHRCCMSPSEARREIFLARSLDDMPYAVKSVVAGRLSLTQLEILAHALRRHPEPYAEEKPALVESICGKSIRESRGEVEYWCQSLDEKKGDDDEPPSRLFLSRTWRDRGRLDGDLDPQTHDLVNTALDQLMGEIVRETPAEELAPALQRRAEALAELARRFLDSPHAPTDHGNRPHLTVVVDWQTLTGERLGGLSELLDGTVITPAHARRLACDAVVCRLLNGPGGEILDLGRSQRTVSSAQWKALRIRDRHCQWPGCSRPWTWCDAHHIRHWTRHLGPTDLDNMILLCRRHHTLIHRNGWALSGAPGDLTITRPDGTELPNAPP